MNDLPLPWVELMPMLSIHPDAASRNDVARLATELMEAVQMLTVLIAEHEALRDARSHRGMNCNCEACLAWKRTESILEKQR